MVVALAPTSGCFAPSIPDGAIACGEAGCPDGLSCAVDGYCYRDPDDGFPPSDGEPQTRQSLIAVANYNQPSRIYAYCGEQLVLVWSAPEAQPTTSVAWGDVTRNGDPELVFGNFQSPSRVYDVSDVVDPMWASWPEQTTRAISLADYDGDGDADLAAGTDGQIHVYKWIYEPAQYEERWSSEQPHATTDLAWARDDDDNNGNGNGGGHPDWNLAIAAWGEPNTVYHTEDDSWLFKSWESTELDNTNAIAWGDIDGDGDYDLAVGNWHQPTRVYMERGWGNYELVWSSPESDPTTSIAIADFDGDGRADLAVGNDGAPNRIYRSEGDRLELVWSSEASDRTTSVQWGDVDGDGDLDLMVGNEAAPNRLYRNDQGALTLAWSSAEADATSSIAWTAWELDDGDVGLCP